MIRLELLPPTAVLAILESEKAFTRLFGSPPAPGLRGFYHSPDVSTAWLESLRTAAGPDPWQFGFAIIDDATKHVIGAAGFKGPPDAAGMVEIAYGVVPAFEGRGVATAAARMLVQFASADPRVSRLRAHTLPEASASGRVLVKNGFHSVGTVIDPDDGPVCRWERPPH
jgi:RimJ/RimL family protein N-acetyltransferase